MVDSGLVELTCRKSMKSWFYSFLRKKHLCILYNTEHERLDLSRTCLTSALESITAKLEAVSTCEKDISPLNLFDGKKKTCLAITFNKSYDLFCNNLQKNAAKL